jgi:hypothetical protein
MSSRLIYHRPGESNQSADSMGLRRRYLLEIGLSEILLSYCQKICFSPNHSAWLLKLCLLRGKTKQNTSIMSSRSTKVRIRNFYWLRIFLYFILSRDYPWFRIAGQFNGSGIEESPWRGVGPNSRMVQEDFDLKTSFIIFLLAFLW